MIRRPRFIFLLLLSALLIALFVYRNELRDLRQAVLVSASAQADINVMRVALLLGADVNAREKESGLTPLASASFSRRKESVEFLIENGADINAVDSKGALGTTAYFGHLETGRALIDAGFDVNAKAGSESALMIASRWGYLEMVRLLIDAGANLDRDGEGAIKNALIADNPEIAKLLIERGVNVQNIMPADPHSTLFDYAKRVKQDEKRQEIINLLKLAKAKE
jgi:ankyrin repeat protein